MIGGAYYITPGWFSRICTLLSSNRRETIAGLRALLYLKPPLQRLVVRGLTIKTDNGVTVFNLQQQGVSVSVAYGTR
jgi:hypothetical protein